MKFIRGRNTISSVPELNARLSTSGGPNAAGPALADIANGFCPGREKKKTRKKENLDFLENKLKTDFNKNGAASLL